MSSVTCVIPSNLPFLCYPTKCSEAECKENHYSYNEGRFHVVTDKLPLLDIIRIGRKVEFTFERPRRLNDQDEYISYLYKVSITYPEEEKISECTQEKSLSLLELSSNPNWMSRLQDVRTGKKISAEELAILKKDLKMPEEVIEYTRQIPISELVYRD